MSYIQSENVLFFFAVFDSVSHHLLYTKYNFNFELYRNELTPNIDIANKAKIFHDFLVRNESSLDKPFSVKSEKKLKNILIHMDIVYIQIICM